MTKISDDDDNDDIDDKMKQRQKENDLTVIVTSMRNAHLAKHKIVFECSS